jgi:NADH-quinone oxidoreductase subunit L
MEILSPTQLACVSLLLPLAVAGALSLIKSVRVRGWPAVWLSVAAATLAALAAVALLVTTDPSIPVVVEASWLPLAQGSLADVGLRIDGISTCMLAVVTIVAWAVQVFSIGYMRDEPAAAKGRYFTYHSLFIFSMNLLVLAPNLLQFFVGWELVGLTSYLLIGFYYKRAAAGHAAIKAFWVTKFADTGLVFGLLVLFVDVGSFAFDATPSAAGVTIVTLLLFLAVMGKSAQFPLHVWLPNAMEGPTPVSALLHAATMVAAGVYLLVRASPLFLQAPVTLEVMVWVGAITAIFAATVALYQTDIKRVLAYSTCSQLGYMVAAVGAGAPVAAYFHLTTHAFFKALLFLAAGSVIHAVHSNELDHMGGLGKKMPITAVTFTLGALALAGLPGLSGFFSKDLILESVAHHQQWGPLVLLFGAAFLTAFYMSRVAILAFLGESSPAASHAKESPRSMTIPLLVLALGALGAGWFGQKFAERSGGSYEFHWSTVGIVGSSLGILGILSAWVVYAKRGYPLEANAWFQWGAAVVRSRAIDRFYERLFYGVVMRLSRAIGWFDRYVIDGVMNWFAWISMALGRRLQQLQTGNVLDYGMAVAAGTAALVVWRILS